MKLFTGIREGKAYACPTGRFVGQLLIYMDQTETDYGFLSIPLLKNVWIPKDVFDNGLKVGYVEYVKKVPRYVKKTSKAQFEQNRKDL